MAHENLTRKLHIAQKKGVCVATIQFNGTEVAGTGAVYVSLPERVVIQRITSNVLTAGAATSTVDIIANSLTLVNELAVSSAGVTDETVIDAARYLVTGGEITITDGANPPGAALDAEVYIEYIEVDKHTGEYTEFLNSVA